MKRCASFFAFLSLSFQFLTVNALAADNKALLELGKQVIESNDCLAVKAKLEEASASYFKENKYSDFADFLGSALKQKNNCPGQINYYLALTRFKQLKHLEEAQSWDEYFAQGNDYRQQLTESAQKAIELLPAEDALVPATRLLLWQFHRDQQDAFHEQALTDLVSSLGEYAKKAKDADIIRQAADKIYSYGEKAKAKEAYKLYTSNILNSSIGEEELSKIAGGFLKEGNIELAENIYDAYIERLLSRQPQPQGACNALVAIAKGFALGSDCAYAEKVFAKAAGFNCMDEDVNYLRALNAEKAKEYTKAKDLYLDFSQKYPQSARCDQALFRSAVIDTYILSRKKEGSENFVKLSEREKISPQSMSAVYQLGLLAQYEGDMQKAKAYYNKLLEKAGENFSELTDMSKNRLKEIENQQPLESNLKAFLDLALKVSGAQFDASQVSVVISPYSAKKGAQVEVAANTAEVSAGCMPVEKQYLWSGDLGNAAPMPNLAGFPASYKDPGTKVIFLAASAAGSSLGYSLDMLDVE